MTFVIVTIFDSFWKFAIHLGAYQEVQSVEGGVGWAVVSGCTGLGFSCSVNSQKVKDYFCLKLNIIPLNRLPKASLLYYFSSSSKCAKPH